MRHPHGVDLSKRDPLGAAAASYGVGRISKTDGQFVGTLRGAYIGAGIGVAVGAPITWLLLESLSAGDDESASGGALTDGIGDALVALMVGALVYVGGTLVGSVSGYAASIGPAVMSGSGGEAIPGLRLKLQL